MKKTVLYVFCAAMLAGTMPGGAAAKSISDINVAFSQDINADCMQPSDRDPVNGCLIAEDAKIILRINLPEAIVPYIFLKLMGHYLLGDVSHERLVAIAKPVSGKQTLEPREYAAEQFAVWIAGGKVPAAQSQLFIELLSAKD